MNVVSPPPLLTTLAVAVLALADVLSISSLLCVACFFLGFVATATQSHKYGAVATECQEEMFDGAMAGSGSGSISLDGTSSNDGVHQRSSSSSSSSLNGISSSGRAHNGSSSSSSNNESRSSLPPPSPAALRRPLVSEMLTRYSQSIDALQAAMVTDGNFDARRHDRLFLLRFLLSHESSGGRPNVTRAAAAVRRALQLRAERKLDEVAAVVRSGPSRVWLREANQSWMHYLPVQMSQPDPDGPILLCTRAADIRFHQIASEVSWEEYSRVSALATEFIFERMDQVTRRTGRITKYIRVLDLSGVRPSQISLKFMKMDGEQSKRIQCLYPQLLGAIIYLNPPPSLAFLYKHFVRPLLPRKVTEKSFALSPRKSDADRALLQTLLPVDSLHATFGGTSSAYFPPDPSEADAQVAACVAQVMSSAWNDGVSRKDINARLVGRAADEVEATVRRGDDPSTELMGSLWPRLARELGLGTRARE
jgi:hypothetical protein